MDRYKDEVDEYNEAAVYAYAVNQLSHENSPIPK